MPEQYRLYLDQMFPLAVGKVLREQGYDGFFMLHALCDFYARTRWLSFWRKDFLYDPTTSENILRILMPFLRDHNQEQFKDNLVILSEKRAKWIRTA